MNKVWPKRGYRFYHTKWLDSENKSLRCEVTAIRSGVIYYAALAEDGHRFGREKTDIERFWSLVREH